MVNVDKNVIKTIFNQNIEKEKNKQKKELENFIRYSNEKINQVKEKE